MSKKNLKAKNYQAHPPKRKHRIWELQEAKACFSELLNEVEKGAYQTITKNGRPVAVVISTSEFEKIHNPENTLIDFFKQAPLPEIDLELE